MITNVWDDQVDSLEQANMFLRAPFVKGSWIIVTSRFKKALRNLKIDENACLHVSKLERELLSLHEDNRILDRETQRLPKLLMAKRILNKDRRMLNLETMCVRDAFPKQLGDEPSSFRFRRPWELQYYPDKLSKLTKPECTTRIQSHSQSPPSTQRRKRKRIGFKTDKNKEDSLSLHIQTENAELLTEGMTSDATMSVEELQLIPQMIQPMDIGHGGLERITLSGFFIILRRVAQIDKILIIKKGSHTKRAKHQPHSS